MRDRIEIPAELLQEVRLQSSVTRPLTAGRFAGVAVPQTDIRLGQRVHHELFGEGVVLNFEGQGPSARVQVNFDDEGSKSGVEPRAAAALCDAIAAQSRLRLRGLMAIPAPLPDRAARRSAFARMRALFESLRAGRSAFDTLSMGMSDDFELAIAEGATMVRIGTALFGARH